MEGIRLNKFLSEAGICSRREADRLIDAGEVTVDGRAAGMGERVTGSEVILCRGRRVRKEERPVLLAFHKPRGIVCTAEKKEKNNVVDYVNYPVRIYPVGRLDKESQGLLLLTNRGELVNKIMRAGNYHEKEYWVSVDKPVTGEFLQKMSQGVIERIGSDHPSLQSEKSRAKQLYHDSYAGTEPADPENVPDVWL